MLGNKLCLLVWGFVICNAPVSLSADDREPLISRLIEQLGNSDYQLRNSAEEELLKSGLSTFVQVETAAQTASDTEVRLRAARILKILKGELLWAGEKKESDLYSLTDVRGAITAKMGEAGLFFTRPEYQSENGLTVPKLDGLRLEMRLTTDQGFRLVGYRGSPTYVKGRTDNNSELIKYRPAGDWVFLHNSAENRSLDQFPLRIDLKPTEPGARSIEQVEIGWEMVAAADFTELNVELETNRFYFKDDVEFRLKGMEAKNSSQTEINFNWRRDITLSNFPYISTTEVRVRLLDQNGNPFKVSADSLDGPSEEANLNKHMHHCYSEGGETKNDPTENRVTFDTPPGGRVPTRLSIVYPRLFSRRIVPFRFKGIGIEQTRLE